MMRRSLAFMVVFAGSLSSIAHAQTGRDWCVQEGLQLNLSGTINSDWSINATSCEGEVFAWALVVDMIFVLGEPCCSNNYVAVYSTLDGPRGKREGCSAFAQEISQNGGLGVADIDWTCTSGQTYVHTESRTFAGSETGSTCGPVDVIDLSLGSAAAGGVKVFEVAGPVLFESDLSVDVEVLLSSGTYPRQSQGAVFVHESVVGPGANSTRKGLYGLKPDGTVSRFGVFTGTGFDPSTITGGYEIVNTTPDTLQVSISGAGSVTYESRFELINAFDGNMDPEVDGDNAIVCYEDRAILYGLLGTSFSGAAYNPRSDLDLDGDVDASDLAIFNQLPCNANWDCSTTPPVLNSADFTAYMQSFAAADPVADVDGSGSLNVADYTAFLNAYAVGCN
jgi:hypothetical protein